MKHSNSDKSKTKQQISKGESSSLLKNKGPTTCNGETVPQDYKNHSKEPGHTAYYARINIYIMAGILIVTIIYAVFAGLQWSILRETRDSTQRAFLFLKEYQTNTDIIDEKANIPTRFVITPLFVNSGQTPAMNVMAVTKSQFFDSTIPDEQIAIDIPPTTEKDNRINFIGPGIIGNTGPIVISIEDAISMHNKSKRLFVQINIKYNDVFEGTPLHHSNIFCELIIKYDPTIPVIKDTSGYFMHIPFWKYNSAD